MRKLLFIILFINFSEETHAQTVAIANENLNVAYAGIPNPITIAVENYKPGQVIVSTDNGTLVSKGNGKYDYMPLKEGKAVIKIAVKAKNRTKEIGQSVYRIKLIPRPVATTDIRGSCMGGFRLPQKVKAIMDGWDFDGSFEITDFKLIILSNDSIISTTLIKGANFPPHIFDAMKAKDRIFIENVHCIGPDKRIQTLNPIVVTFN